MIQHRSIDVSNEQVYPFPKWDLLEDGGEMGDPAPRFHAWPYFSEVDAWVLQMGPLHNVYMTADRLASTAQCLYYK